MASAALTALLSGVAEVRALREHYPVRAGALAHGTEAVAAKAHGRACVVLLSSHYERYFRAVNEEAVDWLNAVRCPLDRLSVELLLQHSQSAVDDLAKVEWTNREPHLRDFARTDMPLWQPAATAGALDHARLLTFMKAPRPQHVARLYRLHGVPDVFGAVTRSPTARKALYFDLTELVEKRNNIAHGDAQTEALTTEITRYLRSVSTFTRSADGVLARALRRTAQAPARPW